MSSLPEGRGIRKIRSTLVALAAQAQTLELESFEDLTPAQLADEPRARVVALVEATMAQLDRLAEVVLPDEGADHEQPLSQQSSSLFAEIRRLKSERGELHIEQISDLAYLAAMELHQRLGTLKSLDARRDRWHQLSCLGSSVGHVTKVVSIVETALAMLTGEPGHLDTAEHLARSLETRRLYARFGRTLQEEEEATENDETSHQRLQRAASSIAQLVGSSFCPHLRINDRVQLWQLQERIVSWLRGGDGFDRLGGERLWRDLLGFADLIMAVNRRHELEIHDRRLLHRLQRELSSGARALLSTDQLGNLRQLSGRSEDLDDLLQSQGRAELTPDLLIPRIDRLLVELGEAHDMSPEGFGQ